MNTFSVSFEIDLDAENPLEAAKKVENLIKENDGWQYYVQNQKTKEIFSVDLGEVDDEAVLPVAKEEYQPIIK